MLREKTNSGLPVQLQISPTQNRLPLRNETGRGDREEEEGRRNNKAQYTRKFNRVGA